MAALGWALLWCNLCGVAGADSPRAANGTAPPPRPLVLTLYDPCCPANGMIWRATRSGAAVQPIIDSGFPEGLAVDVAHRQVLWTDRDGRVRRADIAGGPIDTLLDAGLGDPGGMALDPLTQDLFIVDTTFNAIRRLHVDSGALTVVINGLDDPTDVAIDPMTHHLWWVEAGADGGVFRAELDGASVVQVTAIPGWRLALHPLYQQVFWSSPTGLYRAAMDGAALAPIVEGPDILAIAVDTDDDRLLWSEGAAVWSATLDGADLQAVLTATKLQVRDMALDYMPLSVVAGSPPCGAVDARAPGAHTAGPAWDQVTLTFDGPAALVDLDDFSLDSSDGQAPPFAGMFTAGSEATLLLVAPPAPGTCLSLTYLPSGQYHAFGALPGDVSGDGHVQPADVLLLIDHLNGHAEPALASWQCDLDRSGSCEPLDLLRWIDLVNGSAHATAWENATLPPCAP